MTTDITNLLDTSNLTTFKNPFTKKCVDWIDIEIHKNPFFGSKPVNATVWFENNNTKGFHKITGDSLLEVVQKIENFIETL